MGFLFGVGLEVSGIEDIRLALALWTIVGVWAALALLTWGSARAFFKLELRKLRRAILGEATGAHISRINRGSDAVTIEWSPEVLDKVKSQGLTVEQIEQLEQRMASYYLERHKELAEQIKQEGESREPSYEQLQMRNDQHVREPGVFAAEHRV